MSVRIMSESEFESIRIGDKVTFYKKPIEYPDVFDGLAEFKEYNVISKYYKDLCGPTLKTFTILERITNYTDYTIHFFLPVIDY